MKSPGACPIRVAQMGLSTHSIDRQKRGRSDSIVAPHAKQGYGSEPICWLPTIRGTEARSN
eukprot:8399682-Heterocapsa_arctica.AAC.1